MTNEEEKTKIAALLEERAGYERAGRKDRVADVDAELKKIGYQAEKPVERAAKRPAQKQASRR